MFKSTINLTIYMLKNKIGLVLGKYFENAIQVRLS